MKIERVMKMTFFIYEKKSQASTDLLLDGDYQEKGISQTSSDQLEDTPDYKRSMLQLPEKEELERFIEKELLGKIRNK